MIISIDKARNIPEFVGLMQDTDKLLNEEAKRNESYFIGRGGKALETDVFNAMNAAAKGTLFENTIRLVSGSSFPDIVANKYYGVEVKSTEKNHWKSIGSSILESTRIKDVERIFLTFGKLGKPVEFRSRPYENRLSGISVTHYPRYQIDMELEPKETIFDKMGISYDELRTLDNPVVPVSQYYRSKLKPGESLWWAADNADTEVPMTVKLWSVFSKEQKEDYITQGYVYFPELFSRSTKKYNRYALWLATQKGIVNPNIRDGFSAGGQVILKTSTGIEVKMPAVYGRVAKYKKYIEDLLLDAEEDLLKEYWQVDEIEDRRVVQWCRLVSEAAHQTEICDFNLSMNILANIFYKHFKLK